MKNILYLITISLLPLGIMAQEGINQTDKQGKKQGRWEKVNKNGYKIYEGEFIDDYEIGDFVYYYPTGKTKTILSYSNKGIDAKSKNFYEDGVTVLSEGNYKNRKKDGIWLLYSEIGTKIAQESYLEGLKDGEWIVYDNDIIVERITWKNDEKNGIWHKKFEAGYLYGTYKDGKLSGVYEEFFHNKKPKVKGYYDNEAKTGEWTFFNSEGNKIKVEKWKNDVLVSSRIFINGETSKSIDSIAYYYSEGEKNSEIVTLNGEKIICQYPIDELAEIIGTNSFILINYKKKFYARYSCIGQVEEDTHGNGLIITLNPIINPAISPDEEGTKALRSFFLNE